MPTRSGPPHRWRLELASLVLFAILAVLHTWPLATSPGTLSRNDNADTVLNEWTLAWVSHALVTSPLHLFDGNIYYPEKRTVAFSEHMLPQSLLVAPVLWLGGSPVLAYNLALLAGFALTGWAFSHLVWRWTGSWPAGLIAGSLAAFNSHSFTRFGHLQAQHIEFLPLALMALDRLLREPAARQAVSLACWMALQSLTSGYYLAFTAISMVAAALARPIECLERRRLVALGGAAVAASLVLLPFVWPYIEVSREHGFVRSLADTQRYSAALKDYAITTARLHWTWVQFVYPGAALFPGVLGILLAGTSIATGTAFKDRRARMWTAVAVVTFCLSFGVKFPLYAAVYHLLPPLHAVRNVSRFGQVTLLALAVLGGFGAAWWLGKLQTRLARGAVAVLLLVVVQAEAWHAPVRYSTFTGIPRINRTLAGQHGAAVYLPYYGRLGQPRHAPYMLASTAHWLPILNGFSGFEPASTYRHAEHLATFPDTASIAYLRSLGVRFVVVETAEYRPADIEAVDYSPDLHEWTREGSVRIYTIR
jgi:hypothetical protein